MSTPDTTNNALIRQLEGWSTTIRLTEDNHNRLEWQELAPLGICVVKAAEALRTLSDENASLEQFKRDKWDRLEKALCEVAALTTKLEQVRRNYRDRINELEAENEKLKAFRTYVIGWRENDWPEGFSRSTAEYLAEAAKEAEKRC